jgi:O-antigen biosynthesis protein
LNVNPLDYPIIFSEPERLTQIPSWQEHIPFAMFLIACLKPRLLVELGTLYGDSYCAFCQTVKTLQLDTRCFAVDTWLGDEHASFNFTAALPDLRAHHDTRYSGFSTLLQSTFDEALPKFADHSIDLLHIDGFHAYEAVRHDFETWQPKVKAGGIVLFHDTNVLERGFGVRQFWDELRCHHPHFEFLHGHGLGVLALGENNTPELQWLFHADPAQTEVIRTLFHWLGNRLTLRRPGQPTAAAYDQAIQRAVLAEQMATELRTSLQTKEAQALDLHTQLQIKEAQALDLQTQLQTKEAQALDLHTQLQTLVNSRAWRVVNKFWRWRAAITGK